MKPPHVATLALVGLVLWIPPIAKTISRDRPNSAVNLVAENMPLDAEIQAAEDVRQRHLPEMLKIRHVVNMGIDLRNSDITFNVQVDKEENVPQVERMVPPKLEGYDVEVGAVPIVYGLPSHGSSAVSAPDGQ
jgi:hypothetical protein